MFTGVVTLVSINSICTGMNVQLLFFTNLYALTNFLWYFMSTRDTLEDDIPEGTNSGLMTQ